MNYEELKHRDNTIRSYFLNKDWDKYKSGRDYPDKLSELIENIPIEPEFDIYILF